MTQIFLLDDHAMVRDGLRAVLQVAGHAVVGEADSLEDLPGKLLASRAEVLVLDIHLKGASGLSALQNVHAQCPNLRSIVLSMSTQAIHISEALRLGASGYVLKGSASVELLNAIAAVVRGNQYLGDQVNQHASGLTLGKGVSGPAAQLSMREMQILDLVVRGNTSASIASNLNLSPKTVETYRSRLMTKLGICDLPALVRFAIQWGLLDVNESQSN
jgi:DNA-binding NarL/FixJ family response regulator